MFSLALLLFITSCPLAAQEEASDYYINSHLWQEQESDIWTENSLFLVPLLTDRESYARLSDFNFSAVRYMRRGYALSLAPIFLDGFELTNNITSSTDYSLWSALRRAGAVETSLFENLGAVRNLTPSGLGKQFDANLYKNAPRNRINLYMLNRGARGGGYGSSVGAMGRGWRYSATVWGRWGRDPKVKGVFSEEYSFVVNLAKQFSERSTLSLLAVGSAYENGLRSYATQELFELADDNYYNPSWGRFEGKERNSRVAKRFQPLLILKYENKLSDKTTLTGALSYRFGKSKSSGLTWFDAENPYPDYYRKLPSYITNFAVEQLVREGWARGDESYTQIDWQTMTKVNSIGSEATYLLEDRVESVSELEGYITAQTELAKGLSLTLSARYRQESSDIYKEVKDLLNGGKFEDINPYWRREQGGDMSQNNLLTKGRKVGRGERFGYDYQMVGQRYGVEALLSYRKRSIGALLGVKVGQSKVRRKGRYENGLHPEEGSLGRSPQKSFTTYELTAAAEYYVSPKHFLRVSARAAALPPKVGAIFLSPHFSNKIIDNPKTSSIVGFEGEYGALFGRLKTKLVGYYNQQTDESALYRYYDDVARRYSNMVVRGIDSRRWGFELSADYAISNRFNLAFILGAGQYLYSSDQEVELLNDATQKPYLQGGVAEMKNFRIGGTPELVTSAELSYSTFGWIASLTYSFMGNRHVTPNPLWRMSRVYDLALSPEAHDAFTKQSKLPSVGVVNLFLLKSFYFGKRSLTLLGSVNNLLGKEVVYNAYEQMRVARVGEETSRHYLPFDKMQLYGYGRSFYASVTFNF